MEIPMGKRNGQDKEVSKVLKLPKEQGNNQTQTNNNESSLETNTLKRINRQLIRNENSCTTE